MRTITAFLTPESHNTSFDAYTFPLHFVIKYKQFSSLREHHYPIAKYIFFPCDQSHIIIISDFDCTNQSTAHYVKVPQRYGAVRLKNVIVFITNIISDICKSQLNELFFRKNALFTIVIIIRIEVSRYKITLFIKEQIPSPPRNFKSTAGVCCIIYIVNNIQYHKPLFILFRR